MLARLIYPDREPDFECLAEAKCVYDEFWETLKINMANAIALAFNPKQ